MELKVEAFEKHPAWGAVQAVVRRLKSAGFEAFLAGGCVRDGLLNRRPKDFDVATNALPEQVEALFEKTIAVGKSFGVIVVRMEGHSIEVTTFRADFDYKDGRHPERVEFLTALEDAKRRDFTINALFYDIEQQEVLDFVGGVEDLNLQLIRTVGDPYLRFQEDKLRILRAVRFATTLGFKIESQTWKAIQDYSQQVRQVSQERLTEEFGKICESKRPVYGFELLRESGLHRALFGEFRIFADGWASFVKGLLYLGENPDRLAVFAWITSLEARLGGSTERVQEWIQSLRLSRQDERSLDFVIRHLDDLNKGDTEALLLLDQPEGLLLLQIARVHEYVFAGESTRLQELVRKFGERADDQGRLPEPLLSGHDLIAQGIRQGPQIMTILKEARLLQLEGRLTSREEALKWLKTKV